MDRKAQLREAHKAAERHINAHYPAPACSPILGAVYGFFFSGLVLTIAGAIGEEGGRGFGPGLAIVLATAAPYLYFRRQERERSRAYAAAVAVNYHHRESEAL